MVNVTSSYPTLHTTKLINATYKLGLQPHSLRTPCRDSSSVVLVEFSQEFPCRDSLIFNILERRSRTNGLKIYSRMVASLQVLHIFLPQAEDVSKDMHIRLKDTSK